MKPVYYALITAALFVSVLSCSKQKQPSYDELAKKSTRILTAGYYGDEFTDLSTFFYITTENRFDTSYVPVVIWDFGDGTTVQGKKEEYHTYTQPGDYKVMVRADNDTAYIERHVIAWPTSSYTALAARSSQMWKVEAVHGSVLDFPFITSRTPSDTTFEIDVPVIVDNDARVSLRFPDRTRRFILTRVVAADNTLIFEEFPSRERKLSFNYVYGNMEYIVDRNQGKEAEFVRMRTL